MATCEKCGRPLIISGGKCLYCGTPVISGPQPAKEPPVVGKTKHIVQRKTFSTKDGQSPYSDYAGQSFIPGAKTDRFGNPQGSQYDLAKDGAFKGYKVVVLCLYHYSDVPGNDIMANAAPALLRKGFVTKMFKENECNDIQRVREELNSDRCQLWLISDGTCVLSSECHDLIYDHYSLGRGLYLWSDNTPFYADTNVILKRLFNSEMSGEYYGDHVLSIQSGKKTPGIINNHHITTGLQNFYEGITISNVRISQGLKPLVYSSDKKVVTAYYDGDGKRVLIDGGFTRLYYKWNSAGTDRFVVNCASWLTNIERFGYHPES